MANISKMSQYASLNTVEGIDRLNKLQENLLHFDENAKHTVKEYIDHDAGVILNELLIGYQSYVGTEEQPGGMEDKARDFRENVSKPIGYVKDIPNGAQITLYGKNLWYYEFGTGDKGAASNYNSKVLSRYGYEYNKGPKVIKAGSINTMNNSELPAWYLATIAKHPGMANHNWWMSPKGMSNGIPAGKILYDTWRDYKDGISNSGKNISGTRITKNTLRYTFKKMVTKDL